MADVAAVGRTVHYVAYGTPGGEFPAGVCRAAVITEVPSDGAARALGVVSLFVMNPTGLFLNQNVPYDETKQASRDMALAGTGLTDGLYRVVTPYLVAGFVIEGGRVTSCAPILRRKLAYWLQIAERISE